MIIADENIDHSIIAALRAMGIRIYSVYESKRGISDEEVIELSRNPPRIILTEDKDFGTWVFSHQVKDISVVLLRYDFKDTEKMTGILIRLSSKQWKRFIGRFTTITIDNIRSRRLD
jgi:predicted nuclease of predicted toxin-antitoxin system